MYPISGKILVLAKHHIFRMNAGEEDLASNQGNKTLVCATLSGSDLFLNRAFSCYGHHPLYYNVVVSVTVNPTDIECQLHVSSSQHLPPTESADFLNWFGCSRMSWEMKKRGQKSTHSRERRSFA